ncbi:MAG: hypothetical protein ACREJB_14380, partial [Planctomycetaceae bacterium]
MNTRLLQIAVAVLLCAGCRTGLFSAGGRPGKPDPPPIVQRGDADRGALPSNIPPSDIVQAGGWHEDGAA